MYFKNFPIIPYDDPNTKQLKDVTNLLRRVALRTKVKTNTMLFDTYDVKSGETPESIADKLYDDSELHWVIMLVNNITDRYHDWPLAENQFISYISDKYSNVDGIHHYEISQESGNTQIKMTVELADHPTATPITNYEYETNLNDARKDIKILKKQYLTTFIDDYNELVSDNTTWVLKDDVWVAQ